MSGRRLRDACALAYKLELHVPHYYIDTDDDVLSVRDEAGFEFADAAAARDMAHRVLPEMAQHKIPDRDHRTFTANVRDQSGTILYVATLTLSGAWRPPHSIS